MQGCMSCQSQPRTKWKWNEDTIDQSSIAKVSYLLFLPCFKGFFVREFFMIEKLLSIHPHNKDKLSPSRFLKQLFRNFNKLKVRSCSTEPSTKAQTILANFIYSWIIFWALESLPQSPTSLSKDFFRRGASCKP